MRLAQDLHDGVGPYLSAIRLYLNSFGIAENDTKSMGIKKELHELVNLSINSIREISGNLGSHVLRSLGLKAALARYIEKIRLNNLFTYSTNIPDHFPFTENVEIALYRVIIELFNNSVKYGYPSLISIVLIESKTEIIIQYKEDGKGFNLEEALSQHKGMGLYNIHSRINSLGGSVEFSSSPGKGVEARFIFSKTIACKIV
jgi:signal transduction histidine kinase